MPPRGERGGKVLDRKNDQPKDTEQQPAELTAQIKAEQKQPKPVAVSPKASATPRPVDLSQTGCRPWVRPRIKLKDQ